MWQIAANILKKQPSMKSDRLPLLSRALLTSASHGSSVMLFSRRALKALACFVMLYCGACPCDPLLGTGLEQGLEPIDRLCSRHSHSNSVVGRGKKTARWAVQNHT